MTIRVLVEGGEDIMDLSFSPSVLVYNMPDLPLQVFDRAGWT
jgi:hypothetical protein